MTAVEVALAGQADLAAVDSLAQEQPHCAAIDVERVSRVFTTRHGEVEALRELSLSIPAGEFVCVIGPSGCGKSSLFRILAGLDEPTGGVISIDGEPAASLLGKAAYLPQTDALLGFRKVIDNVALGLAASGVSRAEARDRARPLLERSGLAGFANAYPAQLSGGMRQRVAFLRTVIMRRSFMLLDEPFGALDSVTRGQMQAWLLNVWAETKGTVVMVTHDVAEAVYLADRVHVLSARPGQLRATVEIDLPRPRPADIEESAKFTRYEAKLRRELRLAMSEADLAGGTR